MHSTSDAPTTLRVGQMEILYQLSPLAHECEFYFPPCNALSSINPTMLTPTMWLVLPMYLETKWLQDPTLVICPMIDLDLMVMWKNT